MLILNAGLVAWVVLETVLQLRERAFVFNRNTHRQQTLVLYIFASVLVAHVLARTPARLPGDAAVWHTLGGLLVWCGVALRLWAVLTLGRFFRISVLIQDGHRVVQTGPYRYVRHPSYSGFLLACIGYGLSTANLASLTAMLVLNLLGFYYRIEAEERALQEGLGDEYRQYMQRTWRLFPGL